MKSQQTTKQEEEQVWLCVNCGQRTKEAYYCSRYCARDQHFRLTVEEEYE